MDSTLQETVDYIHDHCRTEPVLGLILGSGLGVYAESFTASVILPYSSLPHFPQSSVDGHPGNLLIGSVKGISCIAFQGRFHFYEGFSMQDITLPVQLL